MAVHGHVEQRTDSYSGEPPVKRKRLSLSHKRVSLEVWSGNKSVQSIQVDTSGLDESRFVHISPTRLELSKGKMPSHFVSFFITQWLITYCHCNSSVWYGHQLPKHKTNNSLRTTF